jgi:hypothetical protein
MFDEPATLRPVKRSVGKGVEHFKAVVLMNILFKMIRPLSSIWGPHVASGELTHELLKTLVWTLPTYAEFERSQMVDLDESSPTAATKPASSPRRKKKAKRVAAKSGSSPAAT